MTIWWEVGAIVGSVATSAAIATRYLEFVEAMIAGAVSLLKACALTALISAVAANPHLDPEGRDRIQDYLLVASYLEL